MLYWDFCFQTTVHLINMLPYHVLGFKIPFELLFHSQPDYTYFKTFGYIYFTHLRPYNEKKLKPHFLRSVFLRYVAQKKGYWALEPIFGKAYVLAHVHFNEKILPYLVSSNKPNTQLAPMSFLQLWSLLYLCNLTFLAYFTFFFQALVEPSSSPCAFDQTSVPSTPSLPLSSYESCSPSIPSISPIPFHNISSFSKP